MKKLFKWVGMLAGILVLLAILLVISLATFVSPNRFKSLLAEKVKDYTGRQLIIDGDLSWTIFPSLGVKTGHVVLKNPTGFEQGIFAEITDATISIKLMPLWHKKIESSGIRLDGMKLHLIKNSQGQVNWDFKTDNTSERAGNTTNSETHAKSPLAAIAISGLTITRSNITWTDEQKKQFISLEKFNLQAKNINLLKPFPISSEFNVVNTLNSMKSEIRLSTDVSLNLAAQVFSFRNVEVNARTQKNKQTMNITVAGDVMADMANQTLQWENFKAKSGNLMLNGKINISNLMTNPTTAGHLQVAPFDLRKWLQDSGHDVAAIQVLKNVSGEVDFIPVPKAIAIKGKFVIDDVVVNKIKIDHVTIPLKYQNGVISLTPVNASFYQGKWTGDVKIDLNSAAPQFALFATLSHFDIAALMQDLSPKQKLTLAGDGNIDMQVSSIGNDKNAILKNLNGSGHFNFMNGILQGVDINYLIASATSMATKQRSSLSNTNQTKFGDLKGSFAIHNGVVANDDLLMNSTDFSTKGQGTIDLINQKINYHLQTLVNQVSNDSKKQWFNLYGLPIPVLMTGNLKNPQIRLDADALTKIMAEEQVQKVKTQLQEKIEKGKIPEKAGKFLQHLLGH